MRTRRCRAYNRGMASSANRSSRGREDGNQEELLRAAEKRTLEMIADGASLTDVLNCLCAAIDDHASATSFVCLLDSGGNQLLPIASPNVPSAFAAAITPWPIGPNRGSGGTARFFKKC